MLSFQFKKVKKVFLFMSLDENKPESSDENAKKDYELLREDYPNYDLLFKVIIIGNSSN